MAMKIQTILCTIDLSDYSAQVISWGRVLAKKCRASLVIFHALPPPRERLDRVASFSRNQDMCRAERTITQLMEKTGIPWTSCIVEGEPAVALARAVKENRADLVIAASHGFSGFKRAFVGSVVERMARNSQQPFLVLRCRELPAVEGNGPDIRKIVAACDFPSCVPAKQAACFAELMDADLDVVHCAVSPAAAETSEYPDSYCTMQAKFEQHIKEQMLSALFRERQKQPGRIAVTVQEGDPSEKVIGFALATRCDLMVTGVKPRTFLGKLLTGSTTETLIRQAPCHVLAVPKTKEDRTGRVKKSTGVVIDQRFLDHDTSPGHPESPERLAMIIDLVTGLKTDLGLKIIAPVPATTREILLVHSPRYLEQV
ncbi:MAG: universal stress protein, partial [Desulfobacterales bacterium]